MFAKAFTLATFALATFSSVAAIPTATPHHARAAVANRRSNSKKNWPSFLENYDVYHKRYTALDCKDKHNDKPYFNLCCTPMNKGEKLSSRPDKCDPAKAKVHSASTNLNDDDGEDCEDGNENGNGNGNGNVDIHKPTHHSSAKPTSTKKSAPTSPSKSGSGSGSSSSGGFDHQGGFATFFFQNGGTGACGEKHPDSFPLVALTPKNYGPSFGVKSKNCGRTVLIRNKKNGKTVQAKVMDGCPTCDTPESLDLSVGAFKQIATEAEGEVAIEWKFM